MNTIDRGVEVKSRIFSDMRFALGVCGGIACVETVKLIRELRRHGPEVMVFFTPSVEKFMTPLSVEWASTHPVIIGWDGEVKHLDDYQAVLIAPLTFNTLSKMALGICDNPVTQLAAAQLGKKTPLFLFPTMNESLRNHPLYEKNVLLLRSWGAKVLESELEENRLKIPDPIEIVRFVAKGLGRE